MKKLLWLGFCAGLTLPVCAEEAKPAAAVDAAKPVAVVEGEKPSAKQLNWNGGADLRIRQEVLGNMQQRGGAEQVTQNYIRFRPRVWGEVKNEDFKLYMRVTDEMRDYITPDSPNYRWPDEAFIDNLYLDLNNLFDGLVDIRAGRQDFFGANGPVYGSGRVIADGTPADGSRTVYMDAIKTTVKFDEKNALDVLAIYNSPDNQFNVGDSDGIPPLADERPLTSIAPGSTDLTEWGGGLYFRSKEFAEVPFELYYLYKRETKCTSAKGAPLDGRNTHTLGSRVVPKLTETLSAEFEGAVQSGEKDSGPTTSGYMGYAGLTYKPAVDNSAKPYFTGSLYYLSGDKNNGRNGSGSDTGWDPLWSRWPQFSELYAYNSIYGLGYWSNLVYPSVAAGVDIAPGHKVSSSLGPMYTAVQDDLGGGDGSLRGWLGMVRYDFPLFKNIFGLNSKRGELYGHVTAEVLEPGDYYAGNEMIYFLRWEINARF